MRKRTIGANGATWEVEVANADGSTSDVRLDGNYKVIVLERDSETGENAAPDSALEICTAGVHDVARIVAALSRTGDRVRSRR